MTSIKEMIENTLKNNKKFLNHDDKYIQLDQSVINHTEKPYKYIDGLQLIKNDKVRVWVSTENSEEIFYLRLEDVNSELLLDLLQRLLETIITLKVEKIMETV